MPFQGFRQYGVVEGQSRGAPCLTVSPLLSAAMLTRKQRWRRTRTRKNAWGDLPPEVLDSMLTTGMSKSVSWDHSYAAALKIRANKAAEVARKAEKEDSRLKAAKAAAAAIPRSVSCSSLAPKRSLFHRSNSSRDGLDGGGGAATPRRGSTAVAAQQQRRRLLPHRRGVSFNTQVSCLATVLLYVAIISFWAPFGLSCSRFVCLSLQQWFDHLSTLALLLRRISVLLSRSWKGKGAERG